MLQIQPFWDAKKKGHELFPGEYKEIHMPNNSGAPFIFGAIFFVWGFSFVFAIVATADYQHNRILCMLWRYRSFEKDDGRHISVKEIEETETKLRGAN